MIQLMVKSLEVVEGSPLVRVTLQEISGERELHVWIGWPEASAIQSYLEGSSPPRPMTHDLIANLLVGLQAKVKQLLISEMKEDTFFAQLTLLAGEHTLEIDCRPSDGIAIALRAEAPIYISDELLGQIEQLREEQVQSARPGTIIVERDDTTIH
jgi:bifunctional DNase/RNase